MTMVRQAIALCDVEHGIAPQESDRLGLARAARRRRRIIQRLRPPLLRDELVGVADGDTMLAFSDRPAEADGLPEGKPLLRRITRIEQPAPQDQDIDPGIGPARRRIARQSDTGLRLGVAPRLHPRHDAVLELGDDPGRDFFIERCARLLRTPALSAWHVAVLCSLPRTGPRWWGGRRSATEQPRTLEAGHTGTAEAKAEDRARIRERAWR